MADPFEVPPVLLEKQTWFAEILRRPLGERDFLGIPLYDEKTRQDIESRISSDSNLSATLGMGIYHRQYWIGVQRLMQNLYPTLMRFFGIADFNQLIVNPYFLKYPPAQWEVFATGKQFFEWLEETYQEKDKLLVLQLAEIDGAFGQISQIQELPPLKAFDLSKSLILQPFVCLLEVDPDLFTFRKKFLEQNAKYWEENAFPTIHWTEKQKGVLYKKNNNILHEKVSEAQNTLLSCFKQGSSLEDACASLQGDDLKEAEVFIGHWLKLWSERGWFANKN